MNDALENMIVFGDMSPARTAAWFLTSLNFCMPENQQTNE